MPVEVHEHFDNDDQPTGYTVIHRESEWDEQTRQRAIDLAEFEDNQCPCGCGRSALETFKSNSAYRVHTAVCAAGRAIAQVRRQRAEGNKENPGWDDGLHFYAELDETASAEAAVRLETIKTKRGMKRGR